MRNEYDNCISSQQSPTAHLHYEHKYINSLHAHMFLEDFSGMFSSEFTPLSVRDGFYDVRPQDDVLKKLMQYTEYSYFDYEFDRLICNVMCYLILNGKAYVEIVSWTGEDDTIKGIEFVPVCAKCCHTSREKYSFIAKNHNNETIHFSIDKKRLVLFDLRDLGFHRNYFRKLINSLAEFDATNASELMLDPDMNGVFDFTEYQKSLDYKLLKLTKPIHWLGRNYDNQHLSESYLLYRKIQYKTLRYKFLEYFLQQINEGLDRFKCEWGFSGKISISYPLPDYKNAFNQYKNGQINSSQLCKLVIENITLAEEL